MVNEETLESLTENLLEYFDGSCGYHNTLKQYVIRRLAAENPMLKWYHFGDLDPDGFFILEHLKRGTGLAFEAYHMGVEDLERYRDFGKSLEENDRKKAETLMARGLYREELAYMLQENIKLEQEIISWKEKISGKTDIGRLYCMPCRLV